MDNIKIRQATIDDLPAIQFLNNELCKYEFDNGFDNESYIDNWSLGKQSEDYFTNLVKNQFVMIAENVDSCIVGYLAGSILDIDTYSYYNGKTAELENTFILSDYRGSGIGSELANKFFEYCKQSNVKRVMVTASAKNENTIGFYKKFGFEVANITLKKQI